MMRRIFARKIIIYLFISVLIIGPLLAYNKYEAFASEPAIGTKWELGENVGDVTATRVREKCLLLRLEVRVREKLIWTSGGPWPMTWLKVPLKARYALVERRYRLGRIKINPYT